jgi:hypothetical protein
LGWDICSNVDLKSLIGLSSEICSDKSVIIRSLLKREAPRFSADLHPLSVGGPLSFLCHLIQALAINRIITISDINIQSAVFNRLGHRNGHGNRHGNGQGNGKGHGTEMEVKTDNTMIWTLSQIQTWGWELLRSILIWSNSP